MSRWTGSATERVFACPASLALPAVDDSGNEYTSDGQTMHEYVYRCLTQGREDALEWVALAAPELLPRCAAVDLSALFTAGVPAYTEIAVAYDVETDSARILGTNLGRTYPVTTETEIPMTIDVVLRSISGLLVLDIKSGWKFVSEKDNAQIGLHALALSRALRVDEGVSVGILTIDAGGAVKIRTEETDDLDLGAFAHRVRQAWRAAAAAREVVSTGRVPDVRTGDHCAYCPAYASCPARVAMARSVLSTAHDGVADKIALMRPDEAGELWERAESAKKLLKSIEEGLRAYAERNPLRLPDGREVAMVQVTQTRQVMVPTGETKSVTFMRASTRKPRAA